MSATTESSAAGSSASGTAIRPFSIPIAPEAELDDLRARISATRWPERETVTDDSQHEGAQIMTTRPQLIYYHQVDRDGHFAAWEQPDLFTAEMRAAFRSLR